MGRLASPSGVEENPHTEGIDGNPLDACSIFVEALETGAPAFSYRLTGGGRLIHVSLEH